MKIILRYLLFRLKKVAFFKIVPTLDSLQEMQAHIDKINEMATVMRKAIEVDEDRLCEDEERIKQLEVKL